MTRRGYYQGERRVVLPAYSGLISAAQIQGAPVFCERNTYLARRVYGRSIIPSRRLDHVCRFSAVFRDQEGKRVRIKDTTRGATLWEIKAAQVHLVDASREPSRPTDRRYWLIVARNPSTKEYKYLVSNAPRKTGLEETLRVAFARWHVEMWFERAK